MAKSNRPTPIIDTAADAATLAEASRRSETPTIDVQTASRAVKDAVARNAARGLRHLREPLAVIEQQTGEQPTPELIAQTIIDLERVGFRFVPMLNGNSPTEYIMVW
jgi:hypothetical protein